MFEVLQEYVLRVLPYYLFKFAVAFLIVVLGLALGFLVKGFVRFFFHSFKLDSLFEKLKVNHLFGKISTVEVFADFFEFYVFMIFFVEALNYIDFFSAASLLTQFLSWLPKLLAGLVLFLVFYVVIKYVESLILNSQHKNVKFFVPYINFVLITFAFIISLEQIGFKVDFLKQAFLIVLFMFSLAFAIAFGLALGFSLKEEFKKVLDKHFFEEKTKGSRKVSSKRKKKR